VVGVLQGEGFAVVGLVLGGLGAVGVEPVAELFAGLA
jgi:hypothetical protein